VARAKPQPGAKRLPSAQEGTPLTGAGRTASGARCTFRVRRNHQFDTKRNVIEVLDVGPHENFYRELQKYLDAR